MAMREPLRSLDNRVGNVIPMYADSTLRPPLPYLKPYERAIGNALYAAAGILSSLEDRIGKTTDRLLAPVRNFSARYNLSSYRSPIEVAALGLTALVLAASHLAEPTVARPSTQKSSTLLELPSAQEYLRGNIDFTQAMTDPRRAKWYDNLLSNGGSAYQTRDRCAAEVIHNARARLYPYGDAPVVAILPGNSHVIVDLVDVNGNQDATEQWGQVLTVKGIVAYTSVTAPTGEPLLNVKAC